MFEVSNFIDRKKAGMILVCRLIAEDFESQAKSTAKWNDRTTNARQALNAGSEGRNGKYTIYVAHGVDYGEILEEGSKPHDIHRKNGRYWRHPGTKGFKTIETVLEDNKDKTIQRIAEYWSD